MDRVKMWRKMVGRSSYWGSGRRSGGPLRGNSRGNFGSHYSRSGGSGSLFRGRGQGRGRGRGGSRHFSPRVASSSQWEPSATEDAELTDEEPEPSPVVPEEAPEDVASAPAPVKAASNKRGPQVVWCELCKVDCTSLEILEQHKNGKRHKKNLQKLGELESVNKTEAEKQDEQNPATEFKPEGIVQPDSVIVGEENNPTPLESLPTYRDSEDQKQTEHQNDSMKQREFSQEEPTDSEGGKPRVERFDNWSRGMKHKMRGGGRRGKHMRAFEGSRWPVEPPKPKVSIPLICDLCNVKCDTQEVFDRHLVGKKHISKLKRFESHQAMYGPVGLQALYPPNPIAQTIFLPQVHQQAFYGPQGSFPPPGPYMPAQAHQAAPPPPAAGSDAQFQQSPYPQSSEATATYDSQTAIATAPAALQQSVAAESEIEQAEALQQSLTTEPDIKQHVTVETSVNGNSEFLVMEPKTSMDNIEPKTSMDNIMVGTEHVIPATFEAATAPDYENAADLVTFPGLDAQAAEGVIE